MGKVKEFEALLENLMQAQANFTSASEHRLKKAVIDTRRVALDIAIEEAVTAYKEAQSARDLVALLWWRFRELETAMKNTVEGTHEHRRIELDYMTTKIAYCVAYKEVTGDKLF